MTPEAYAKIISDLTFAFNHGRIYQSVKLQYGARGGLVTFTKVEWDAQPTPEAKLELFKTREKTLKARINL